MQQAASNAVDFPHGQVHTPLRRASRVDAERDRQFATMLRAFRETGGLARGDEVAQSMAQRGAGDVPRLARWIVSREVLGFDWKDELWVPLFQFDARSMVIRPAARLVLRELSPGFDNWCQAQWFSTPNTWLGGRLPAVVLDTDLPRVLEAARADRSAIAG